MSRLLDCHEHRIIELESSWTRREKMNIVESYNGIKTMIPRIGIKYRIKYKPTQHDRLPSSVYDMTAGINKYSNQYKNNFGAYNNFEQHLENWLQQNNLHFDEIRTAEFNLNVFTEENELELLLDTQIHHPLSMSQHFICVMHAGAKKNVK